ncbi:MAG: HNH endonuclease [Nitrospira sp. CG24E]|nr:MAG: HNH endonuclease [Nitrospira sp. CG24E]
MSIDELKAALVKSGWHPETLELAIATGFRCQYCDKYFFEDVDSWYAFERDHIAPRDSTNDNRGNLTAACRTCNRLKRRTDPRKKAPNNPTREQLIDAAKQIIDERRAVAQTRLEWERVLVDELLLKVRS